MTVLLETRGLSKRFVKHLDLAAKIAQNLGADLKEEVVQAVRPSGSLWPGASADAVNQKLAEDHFPNKIMAHDARRKGLDQSEAFLKSRVTALDNLMLIKLRRLILAETSAPEEPELAIARSGRKWASASRITSTSLRFAF